MAKYLAFATSVVAFRLDKDDEMMLEYGNTNNLQLDETEAERVGNGHTIDTSCNIDGRSNSSAVVTSESEVRIIFK